MHSSNIFFVGHTVIGILLASVIYHLLSKASNELILQLLSTPL